MKVKIFADGCANGDIQEKINSWMEKENPQVKFIKQSESMAGDNDRGSFNLTVSVWYEPKTDKPQGQDLDLS